MDIRRAFWGAQKQNSHHGLEMTEIIVFRLVTESPTPQAEGHDVLPPTVIPRSRTKIFDYRRCETAAIILCLSENEKSDIRQNAFVASVEYNNSPSVAVGGRAHVRCPMPWQHRLATHSPNTRSGSRTNRPSEIPHRSTPPICRISRP